MLEGWRGLFSRVRRATVCIGAYTLKLSTFLFGGVAQAKADEAKAKARREHPEAIRDIKKSDLVHDSGRDQRRRRSFALGQARPAVAPFLPAHRHTAPGLFPSPATGHD